jgi:hypothetical protein
MSWFQFLERWLTNHAITIQAISAICGALFTLVLVATTIAYLVESHKSRKAAERQASAAQESLAIVKREYEDRIGEGPQIVEHAIEASLKSVGAWLGQAHLGSHHPERVADPADLIPPELLLALGHARRISSPCAELINSAISEMRIAITHLQTLRQTPGPTQRIRGPGPPSFPTIVTTAFEPLGRAQKYLGDAQAALKSAMGNRS